MDKEERLVVSQADEAASMITRDYKCKALKPAPFIIAADFANFWNFLAKYRWKVADVF